MRMRRSLKKFANLLYDARRGNIPPDERSGQ